MAEASLLRIRALGEAQVRELHALYQGEWWTAGRELPDIRRMLAHTDLLFGYQDRTSGRLLAFARVLTDRAYKALVFDLIVAPDHRGRGLGKALVEDVLAHPELAFVRHIELYCQPELLPFYARWGFTTDVGGIVLLRKSSGG